MKRVFIIHGWDGYPEEGWFPWLKKELEKRDFKVFVPSIPNPSKPDINKWIVFIKKQVKMPDKETFFVGHSIGCQAILRYMQTLEREIKLGGIVLVAGFVHLTLGPNEDYEIAQPWLKTPIDFNKIKNKTHNIVAIFSDNDPYVPLSDAEIFKNNLNAKIIIEKGKGHFSGSDHINELTSVLNSILEMSKND